MAAGRGRSEASLSWRSWSLTLLPWSATPWTSGSSSWLLCRSTPLRATLWSMRSRAPRRPPAAVPSATAVSSLAIASIGLSSASTATVSVRICSSAVGTNASGNTAQCATPSTGAGAVSGTPDMDPESPQFQLNRVDVVYTVTPPIPIPVSILPTLTFHRMVEMRRMQ